MSPEDELYEGQHETYEGEEEFSILQHLRDSSDRLYDLASFCEKNFKDYEEAANRNITIEDAKVNGVFGSKELEQTGDYAVAALNTIAYSVNLLAINLEEKLDGVSVAVRNVSHNIAELSNYTEMYQRKVDMKHFKEQLTIKDGASTNRRLYTRHKKVDYSNYKFERMNFDFDELDGVGKAMQIANNANTSSQMSRPLSVTSIASAASAEGELVPPVPKIFYRQESQEPKYAKGNFSTLARKRQVTRSNSKDFKYMTMGTRKNRQDTLTRLKKSDMPTLPTFPVMPEIPSAPVQELAPENIPSIPVQELAPPENLRTDQIRISMLPDMPPPSFEEPEEEHDEMLNIVQNPRQKIRMSMLPELPSFDIPDIPDISSLPELLENPEPEFPEMDLPPPPVIPGKINLDVLPDLPDDAAKSGRKSVDKRCTIMREFDAIDNDFADILADLNEELN